MSVEENEMWEYMDVCNGEVRVMPGRYGGGWLAAGCAVIEWEFDEKWIDLVGGDSDYFDAREFFENNEKTVLIECAATARDAFNACVAELADSIAI